MSKRFPRTSQMHGAGSDPADVIQGKVININLARYTVDVYSTFDRKRYMDVPVSSPYMHFARGEGISVFPEVGSLCYICTPGDSSGPFVLAFVMPHENVDTRTDDAQKGTRSTSTPTGSGDATYAGNRPKAKPGDISLSTRDGNFVRLHRGGVLQIGASELAQRIYVPLRNLVTDISENYDHINTGGTISWGIQEGPSEKSPPSQYLHTFRIFADDKYADIKLAMGRVFNQFTELESGTSNTDETPCIMELAIAPQSFDVVTGEARTDQKVETILHFLLDRDGKMFLQVKDNVKLKCEKKFELTVGEGLDVTVGSDMNFTASGLATFTGKGGAHIKGKVVRIGPGKRPAASQGDLVTSFIMAMPCVIIPSVPLVVPGVPVPCVISIGPPSLAPPMGIPGSITSGEPTVLIGG